MTGAKLRKLSIKGFRGARFEVPIDFTGSKQSLAIYGENGSGKSTVTDAIEWFLLGRVKHLWRDECKEDALRHILIEPNDSAEVALELADPDIKSVKSLSSTLKIAFTPKPASLVNMLTLLPNERLILRHAQITEFITKTKGAKKTEIAEIIGYEAINQFRDVVQGTLNALRKDGAYNGAKQMAEAAQAEILRLTTRMIASKEEFLKAANEIIAPFDLGTVVTDGASFGEAMRQLQSKIRQPDRAKVLVELEQIDLLCTSIAERLDKLHELSKTMEAAYGALVDDKETAKQLNIEQFLTRGRDVLESDFFDEERCPFCLTPYDRGRLKTELVKRIEQISSARKKFDEAQGERERFFRDVGTLGAVCGSLLGYAETHEAISSRKNTVDGAIVRIANWATAIREAFAKFEKLPPKNDADLAVGTLRKGLADIQEAVAAKKKTLDITTEEQRIVAELERLTNIRIHYSQFKKNSAVAAAFERQIESLSAMFDAFLTVQNSALQVVLDTISEDVGKFYSQLHPNEEVDKVRLVVVGDEGVEFEYSFHGVVTYPPVKYLSESHLNSLGLCLFLASAKLFNKCTRFLVLDDVVTSFDLGHRRRLLRLLKGEFVDWQVVVLTHERVWFDIIKREMKQSGWLFKEVECDHANGVRLSGSAEDLRTLIETKRKQYDVSNDLRKLCEAALKEICEALEVKVAFRYNDSNEARMSGELLSELVSTINRKCGTLKGSAAFANLDGSNLVINVGSHDNPAKEIVGADVDVALADIDALAKLFLCPDCDRYVEAANRVVGTSAISCRCGKKQMDWR